MNKSNETYTLNVIGHIHTDFKEKFGIPRQSGIAHDLKAYITFEPEYAVHEAFRGIEDYSHLWLMWIFNEHVSDGWSPTVRPPRLGGNVRKGVFATRSPYRPNPIGLSLVRFDHLEYKKGKGPVLYVSGADLLDGTPIIDIKPYLKYTECQPEAVSGFADVHKDDRLDVVIDEDILALLPSKHHKALYQVLSLDPRPSYQHDPERIYGMNFAGYEVRFRVEDDKLYVRSIDYNEVEKDS